MKYWAWWVTFILNILGAALTIASWFTPVPDNAGVLCFLIGAIFAHWNTKIVMKGIFKE